MIDWEKAKPEHFKFKLKADSHETEDQTTFMVLVIHKKLEQTVATLPIMVSTAIVNDLEKQGNQDYLDGLNKIIATEVKEYLKKHCNKKRMDIKKRMAIVDQPEQDIPA